MLVQGKTVVVCGVGPGLGREVAEAALRDGANVVLAARRAEALSEHAKELDPSGERVLAIATDVGDEEQCRALMSAAFERFGSVDATVQVAALDALFGNLESTPAIRTETVSPGCAVAGTVTRIDSAGIGRTSSRGDSGSTERTRSPSPSTSIQNRVFFSAMLAAVPAGRAP